MKNSGRTLLGGPGRPSQLRLLSRFYSGGLERSRRWIAGWLRHPAEHLYVIRDGAYVNGSLLVCGCR